MKEKAIFLDRDDTLIEDPGYINDPDQVKLLDGVPQALIELRKMGYKLIVVSNQSAIARGIITEKTLEQIHERLNQQLAENGAYLDKIYYCPCHPDGVVAKYRKESTDRKPNPGMLLTASKELDIDMEQSWMIGNNASDIEAGKRAGCKTIQIDNPARNFQKEDDGQSNPDYKAVNIKEAVNIIKKCERSPVKLPNPNYTDVTGYSRQPEAKPIMENNLSDVKQDPKISEKIPNENTASGQNNPNAENIDNTQQLLTNILEQLKITHREDMFGEFSIMRFLAGVAQVFVFFCLLGCIWFLMSPNKQANSVFILLGFAVVLQIMSLTFYIMQDKK